MAIYYVFSIFFAIISTSFAADDIIEAINRDSYGRPDPNALLNGFFPAWAIVLLCLAGLFFVAAVLGFIGYKLGCINPKKLDKLQKQ